MNDFLLLSVLFSAPGAVAYLLREDLRPMIRRCALASLPFAASERFFAGTYWSPPSLFGLVGRIGFGIEDVLFVVALAAYMSTGYALFFRKSLDTPALAPTQILRRTIVSVSATLGIALMLLVLGVHILYGAFVAMGAFALFIFLRRRDLVPAGLAGGGIAVFTYAGVCLVFAALRPGVFERIWHTDRFIHRFVLGIPIEELLYGFLAGVVASVFYPYVANLRYRQR